MKAHNGSKLIKVLALVILCMPILRAQETPNSAQPLDDVKALAAKPTPKTADGHPDLSGRWVGLNSGRADSFGGRVEGNVHDLYFGNPIAGADPEKTGVLTDLGETKERRAKEAKVVPAYKPEFQAKFEEMAKDGNHYDPTTYSCLPPGVPRIGAPEMIFESPGLIALLYGPRPYSTFRVIPTDGRAHRRIETDFDPTPMGDPVAHWEGDTLVIDTIGFDDSTWFGSGGYFHSDAMRVIERFTRKGDTLQYSAMVEDPKVLTKPFNLNPTPLTLKVGGGKDILYNNDYPCEQTGAHDFRAHATAGTFGLPNK
jgi:hypothetical protein